MHPNQVWALDFQFGEPSDSRTLKLLNGTDKSTKKALAIEVDRSIDADHTVWV